MLRIEELISVIKSFSNKKANFPRYVCPTNSGSK